MNFNIQTFLETYFSPDEKIVLACSTGADSMFLLHFILQTSYKKNLVACYFNHKTRPECDTEEQFLIDLWKKEGFEVEVADCDFEKIQKLYPSKSFEELAREKRYQFFDAVCHIHSVSKVLTAHHLDDKLETFFFNMLRWSKLTGLINMTESSGNILRPLLWLEKSQILTYLKEHKLKYFEDQSNKDSKYTRNYLRNEVLPLFSKVHPEHKKNVWNLISYFEELKNHLDIEVENFLWKYTKPLSWNSYGALNKYFSLDDFNILSSLLQKEILRYIYYVSNGNSTIGLSKSNIDEILKFLWWKNNKTKKDIQKLSMFKDGKTIWY